jgi:hypothetical protein
MGRIERNNGGIDVRTRLVVVLFVASPTVKTVTRSTSQHPHSAFALYLLSTAIEYSIWSLAASVER